MGYRMTVGELVKACEGNKFILLRHAKLGLVGMNCGVMKISLKQTPRKNDQLTNMIGYIVCSFHEYINYKTPFVQTK